MELKAAPISPTLLKRLEKAQDALATKIMNMRVKDLVNHELMKDGTTCCLLYRITFDRNGNTRSVKAEIGYETKKKYASSGFALIGDKFQFSLRREELLEAIQGTTPAAIEIMEEMKQIMKARNEKMKATV